jgi:ribosomal protein S5
MTSVSGPVAITITKDTRVTGAGVQTLGDLCGQLKQRVEAQTTKDANGKYTAWKVTLLGGQSGAGGNGSGASQETTVQGTIKAIDLAKSSFTLTTPTGDVTVTVSATTEFQGSAHALAQAKTGAHVTVRGAKQADGSVAASKIILEADH